MKRSILVLVCWAAVLACSSRKDEAPAPPVEAKGPVATFSISSYAFAPDSGIPPKYTCEGRDVSPPLAWTAAPPTTRSLVLIADDPDAPDPKAPKMTWVHWVLYDIPPNVTGLAEGASKTLPPGVREGWNGSKKPGWEGPCPPIGRHRYYFKLYALDTDIGGLKSPTKDSIEAAMKGHIISQVQLMGTYQKQKP